MAGGFYVYAIAACGAPAVIETTGIDGNGEPVEMLVRGETAAVASRCSSDRYEVTRANVLAHQRVMEEAMERWTILPVRFDTIADSREHIAEKLLIPRSRELRELLEVMAGKVELGLKALWTDMPAVFAGIVEENPEIAAARNRKDGRNAQANAFRVGEMVKHALDRKRDREAGRILERFDGLWSERKVNSVFGDSMVLNAAFLVESRCETEFDQRVEALAGECSGQMRLKYVGPIPPCNFVEIVVTW